MSDFPSKGYMRAVDGGNAQSLHSKPVKSLLEKKRRRTVNAVCNKLCNFCVRLQSIEKKILPKTFSIKMHVWFYSERPTVFNRRFQNSEYISRKIIFEIDFCWPFLLLQKSFQWLTCVLSKGQISPIFPGAFVILIKCFMTFAI